MRVTLNGIKRRGLSRWKARHLWVDRRVLIWSGARGGYWRRDRAGYTTNICDAGVYAFADAYDNTKHCGPEKRIEFQSVPRPAHYL